MSIPEQTRRESLEETNKRVTTCGKMVYKVVADRGPISAWAISRVLRWDVYVVRPRLTELQAEGKIKAAGKVWCEQTRRREARWDITNKQLPLI